MRLARLLIVAAAAVLVVASCSEPPSYGGLRQSAEEEVPGSWGLVLKPPPGDLEPAIGPRRAVRIALRMRAPGEVLETLALVPGSFVGADADVPAWVVLVRNLCFAQNKGDVVSSSRRDPEDVERCNERNLWVEMIDPSTGESLASLGAYDESGSWEPARAA